MDTQQVLDRLSAIKDAATVDRVYGEARTFGDRMVIPVAEVRHGIGFGFGSGKARDEEAAPEGEGGGGGAMARPAGVVEVTAGGTTFIPIETPLNTMRLILLGAGVGLLIGLSRGRCTVNVTKTGDKS